MKTAAVGQQVRLTAKTNRLFRCPEGRSNNKTARIELLLPDIDGGVKTDRDLRGCRYWNVQDLVAVRKQNGGAS